MALNVVQKQRTVSKLNQAACVKQEPQRKKKSSKDLHISDKAKVEQTAY